MALILGIDFETTGLNPETDFVTEVGMVLWDTILRSPIKLMGFLVNPGPGVVWEEGAIKKTGITPELVEKYGYQDERALKQTVAWHQTADMACAHNGGPFDRVIFNRWCRKYGYDPEVNKLWIDTNTDLELESNGSRRLTYMAADHQFLNPFPHRAVFDVMTMFKVLDGYDLERVIYLAKQPNIKVQALVSYKDRDLAKTRGYRWHADTKQWIMDLKECFLEREKEEAGFPIQLIE